MASVDKTRLLEVPLYGGARCRSHARHAGTAARP